MTSVTHAGAGSSPTPWAGRPGPLSLDEWSRQARHVADAGPADAEHFIPLDRLDIHAFLDRYPSSTDGQEQVGRTSSVRWGYSAAAHNGTEIWALLGVPLAREDGQLVHVVAATHVSTVQNTRVDDDSARRWGARAIVRNVPPGKAVAALLNRGLTAIEIRAIHQPRAPRSTPWG